MKTNAETSTTNTEVATGTETASVEKQGRANEPVTASPKKNPRARKGTPKKGPKASKKAAAKKQAESALRVGLTSKKGAKPVDGKEASEPRGGTKKALILDLLRRKQGATLAEIMKATDWQAHSVRGFIAGTLGKKMGLSVESFKNATDERSYRLPK
jgi:hypothetical protein